MGWVAPGRPLDATDVSLIQLLQADGRRSYESMARALGMSGSAVMRRVARLEAEGVIDGFGIQASAEAFDLQAVTLDLPDAFVHGEEEVVLHRLQDIPWAGAVFNRENHLGLILWHADERDLERWKAEAARRTGIEPSTIGEFRGQAPSPNAGSPMGATDWRVLRALARDPRAPLKAVAEAAGRLQRTTRRAIDRLATKEIARVIPQVQPAWASGMVLYHLLAYTASPDVMRAVQKEVGAHAGVRRLTDPPGLSLWSSAPNLATVLRLQDRLRGLGVDDVAYLTPTFVRWRIPPHVLEEGRSGD